jgi:CheY-like chemotaxis protein
MKRILIIDDNTQLRQLLRQILEREGYEVIDAKDSKSGTKLYRQTLTDLVITDVAMPDKDGIEILRELKRDFPDVKIIATTGDSQTLSAQYYLSAMKALGAERAFTQPFGRKELLNTVHELLNSVTVH